MKLRVRDRFLSAKIMIPQVIVNIVFNQWTVGGWIPTFESFYALIGTASVACRKEPAFQTVRVFERGGVGFI